MRDKLFFLVAASALASAGFVGCGDGEEGGGGGSGGTGGTGGDASTECPTATFTIPSSGAKLGQADDEDGNCSNGVQLDVVIATNAPSGTSATLLADGAEVGASTVSGATITFADAQLKSAGATKLAVRFGGDAKCDVEIDVTSECGNITCDISKPVLSPTHPKLNGVPVAQGGDRVSADGQDYQAAFEVTTTITDGQPVALTVDGKAQAAVALAQAGVAKFAGVTLTPDGDHKVSAMCGTAAESGSSAEQTFPVDSTPPDLTKVAPTDGQFYGPTDDSNAGKSGLQFKVCGETTASDAIDLPASLGAGQNNFCAAVGTASPTCAPASSTGANGAKGGCVELDCPGGAPFDLKVTLTDGAGNPTLKTISGVKCASTLPSVQIVEPVAGTGADVSTHILAATATQARKDQDATKAKAQYTVVACTDVAGGTAKLKVGLASGALTEVASAVAAPAQAADNCPTGLGNVLKFTNSTLDESAMDVNNALTAATRLQVEIQDVSTAKGTSPAVDVWVDSEAPSITEWLPAGGLCGKTYQSGSPVQDTIGFITTNVPIQGTIANSSGTQSFTGAASIPGFVTISPKVTFALGANTVAVTTTEPSGNVGTLKSPCAVTVGNPPVVTWTSPAAATQLNAATDGGAAAGWQGTLTVQTDVGGSGGTVTFKVDCGGTVTTLGTANIDGAGVATLANQTIAECVSAKITAETNNISGKGVGSAVLTKVVDTIVPSAPTGLAASVKDRRATTFGLSWIAPGDSGQTVGGYQVRVAKAALTAANFDAAEIVTFGGTPKAPGGSETLDVTNRIIENDYYFAVAAVDAAGNRSQIVSAGPAKATFNKVTLSGTGVEAFGFAIDGSSSVNGDGLADIFVGARNSAAVRLFLGNAGGYGTTPDVTFTGTAGTRFGFTVAVVGDVDADGLSDIAISAPIEASKGRVYIFKGRTTWPSSLTASSADYAIDVDTVADAGFTNGLFGYSIAPLGDFDGDGAADFAVGSYVYGSGRGYVAVIRGGTSSSPFSSITLPAAVGTKAYAFLGDSSFGSSGWFGSAAVGLGAVYSGGVPALIVGAAGSSAGVVYAFKGGAGLPATTQATAAAEKYTGTPLLRTGNPLTNLGNGVGVGSPATSGSTGGDARLFVGGGSVFGSALRTLTNSQATGVGDQFGNAVAGGAFSGSTATVSLIGGSDPDVAVSSIKLGGAIPAKVYIVEGAKLTTNLDVATQADVTYTLPSDWAGSAWRTSVIRDSNGDGYPELAVGEQGTVLNYAGRVLVLW